MKRCFLAFVVLLTLQGGAEASRLCAKDFVAKVDTLKNDKASAEISQDEVLGDDRAKTGFDKKLSVDDIVGSNDEKKTDK